MSTDAPTGSDAPDGTDAPVGPGAPGGPGPQRHFVVVGGGISGLAAAARLLEDGDGGDRVTVLEASDRVGGVVRTEQIAGRPVDLGADSLVTRTPGLMDVVDDLGLGADLIEPAHGVTSVWVKGRPRELPLGITAGMPDGVGPLLRSGLLSPRGIARAGLDLVMSKTPPDEFDDSFGALIRRRFGREFLDNVVDPLIGGIHHSRCDELSMQVVAPQFAAAAASHRSVFLGLRRQARSPAAGAPPGPPPAAARGSASGPPHSPAAGGAARKAPAAARGSATRPAGDGRPAALPMFVAPPGGMWALAEAFRERIERGGGELRLGAPVAEVGTGTVKLEDGESIAADGVVVALRPPAAARLLAAAAPSASELLGRLIATPILQTVLVLDPGADAVLPPGNGMLIPAAEGGIVRAATWVTRKWPQRGGDGRVVARCSIVAPEMHERGDGEVIDAVHTELERRVGPLGAPREARVERISEGVVAPRPGHIDRIAAIESHLATELPAVRLAGPHIRGSGLGACIAAARSAAAAVATAERSS